MHDCKDIHDKWAAPMGMRNYIDAKRCSNCVLFMLVEGTHCPCCGYHFRYNVRRKRGRKIFKRI